MYNSAVDIIANFIDAYKNLVDSLPHLAVHNFRCENSDYSDQLIDSKNAYLCFNGDAVEDCYYTYDSRWNKNCCDLSFSNKSELCYECVDCEECYNGNFLQDCEKCVDCSYCYNCASCQNCFGCVGLRRAQYQIFNVQNNKEEYAVKLAELKKMPPAEMRAKIHEEVKALRLKHPHVAMHSRRCENCFGDYIFDSKNCYHVFKGHELQDCLYIGSSRALKDCVDCDMTLRSELTYEAVENNANYNCNFLYWSADMRDCEYMMYCFNCENCFGCFNLKRKKYHILNKPYEKDEYAALVSKIKAALRKQNQYKNFLPDIMHSIA